MKQPLLTKSSFMAYLRCPFELWLAKVRPDLNPPPDEALQRLFAQGNRVDALARELHPGGWEVSGYNQAGHRNTLDAIAKGKTVLYQPTAVSGRLTARGDILVKDPDADGWQIHEVKMSTKTKDEHIYDLAFQRFCFESAGIPVTKTFLVHVDTSYVREGDIEPDKLFASDDITQDVLDRIPEIEALLPEAFAVLEWDRDPAALELSACADPAKCNVMSAVIESMNGNIDTFLRTGDLDAVTALIESGIVPADALPKDLLDEVGSIPTAEEKWPKRMDAEEIRAELGMLDYPLHFLDYETYASPIPPFDGYRPFQQIPFQFSVYVVDAPGETPRTYDFLMDTFEDPARPLVEKLREAIGPEGATVSWFAPFEKGRNAELAELVPEHADFLLGINERMYDLMLIFKKGRHYQHPGFKGSASLKKVMPVMVPELSYKDLNIQEGATAAASWPELTKGDLTDEKRAQLRRDMIDYCRLDVYAMVKIMEALKNEVGEE